MSINTHATFIKSAFMFKLSLALSLLALWAMPAQAALKIQHWQTSQGSAVYFVENHDLPIMDISVNFAAGAARDESAKSGLAGLTKSLLDAGAGGLSEEDIAKRLADVGALIGGDLDSDKASVKLRTLSNAREKDIALDLYLRILQQPDFPASVLEREKSRAIAGLREAATQPESISNKAFMQALYGSHPYAKEDEPETIAAIQREDLIAFYQKFYTAKSAVIALIGDISRAEAENIAERIAAGLPQSPAVPALPAVSYPQQANVQHINHPASQSHILLGYPGVKRGDTDYFPLYVGNYILGGGGFVSRLTDEVREKRGLVYSVYSYFMPMAELGPFQIGLQTKREQAEQALQVVNATLEKFVKGGVTAAELKAAKQNITGGFPMRIDSNGKILDYLSVIGFYKLPLSYLDDFNTQVNKVTAAQIKEAFSRRIKPEHFVTVIVGGQ
jgi:zinc protease